MRIQDLWRLDRPTASQEDRTAYVVGTGPSMRLFPIECLRGRAVIALNQAWRYWKGARLGPTLSLTVHPELVLDYAAERAGGGDTPDTRWVVKRKPPLEHLALDDKQHYVFNTSPDWDTFLTRPDDTLFIGRGVQQTAMDLAARMGAHTIVLVGVDMAALGGEHHGHEQHVKFHGLSPDDVYREYVAWTAKARRLLRERWGVRVLSLSPFLGAADHAEDYARLKKEQCLSDLPAPRDTSTYLRQNVSEP